MNINEAINLISQLSFNTQIEQIDLFNATNRVLASELIANDDAPRFSNSAMDGYAINDLLASKWRCIDTIYAGDFKEVTLKPGECVKIMTGAKLPAGSQAVLMVENSREEDGFIYNTAGALKANEAMRMQGEEYKKGAVLLAKNTLLDAAKIMLAAANAKYNLDVIKPIKIAIFASGDELLEPYESGLGVYNSNAYGIASLASKLGQVKYLGILKDDKACTKSALDKASEEFDLIISIGAASMGDADYIKSALSSLGFNELFNKLNLKPGGPVGLFAKNKRYALTLPGNPMSAYTCMQLFKDAFMQAIYKVNPAKPIKAKLSQAIKINNRKENIIYGCLDGDKFVPHNEGKFSSGQISPMCLSTHYIRIFSDNAENDYVDVYSL